MTVETLNELKMDWTGHHLVDVGIATICAMVGKSSPEELTMEDLDELQGDGKNHISIGFLPSLFFLCVYDESHTITRLVGRKRGRNVEKPYYGRIRTRAMCHWPIIYARFQEKALLISSIDGIYRCFPGITS